MEYIKETEILCHAELCGREIKGDDRVAQATILFRNNIRLANHIASKFAHIKSKSFSHEDLIQEAYIGLWHSCLNFDETKGFQFSTYAFPNIQGNILRYLRYHDLGVKIPRWYYDIRAYLLRHPQYQLPLSDTDIEKIISETMFTEEQLRKYGVFYVASLEDTAVDDNKGDHDLTLKDMLPYEEESYDELDEDELEILIDTLVDMVGYPNEKHAEVFEEWLYAQIYDTPAGQHYLANKYDYSQAQICRILNNAKTILSEHKEDILHAVGY